MPALYWQSVADSCDLCPGAGVVFCTVVFFALRFRAVHNARRSILPRPRSWRWPAHAPARRAPLMTRLKYCKDAPFIYQQFLVKPDVYSAALAGNFGFKGS